MSCEECEVWIGRNSEPWSAILSELMQIAHSGLLFLAVPRWTQKRSVRHRCCPGT
jgi:hypothetical protein